MIDLAPIGSARIIQEVRQRMAGNDHLEGRNKSLRQAWAFKFELKPSSRFEVIAADPYSSLIMTPIKFTGTVRLPTYEFLLLCLEKVNLTNF